MGKEKQKTRNQELKNFKLGQTSTQYDSNYNPKLLEAFDNKNPGKVA